MASQPGLLLQGLASFATSLVLAFVARLVWRRQPQGEARLANQAFALWWGAFGALELCGSAYDLASALGWGDRATLTTFLVVVSLLAVLAFGGLTYYLAYLLTGSRLLLGIVVGYWGLMGGAILYLIAWLDPLALDASGAPVTRNHLDAAHGYGALSAAFGLALTLPIILAAIAYGSLYFRATTRLQRFRVAVVSLSFLAWFGWYALSQFAGLIDAWRSTTYAGIPVATVGNALVQLVAPLCIALAFHPPARLRRRLESV